jgi:hypothetical protein
LETFILSDVATTNYVKSFENPIIIIPDTIIIQVFKAKYYSKTIVKKTDSLSVPLSGSDTQINRKLAKANEPIEK